MEQTKIDTYEHRRILEKGKLRFMVEKWQKELPNLKAERVLRENNENYKVEMFRLRRYGKMLLECMRLEADERRNEDQKAKFKQAMWSKVNSWLTEIDNRPAT